MILVFKNLKAIFQFYICHLVLRNNETLKYAICCTSEVVFTLSHDTVRTKWYFNFPWDVKPFSWKREFLFLNMTGNENCKLSRLTFEYWSIPILYVFFSFFFGCFLFLPARRHQGGVLYQWIIGCWGKREEQEFCTFLSEAASFEVIHSPLWESNQFLPLLFKSSCVLSLLADLLAPSAMFEKNPSQSKYNFYILCYISNLS